MVITIAPGNLRKTLHGQITTRMRIKGTVLRIKNSHETRIGRYIHEKVERRWMESCQFGQMGGCRNRLFRGCDGHEDRKLDVKLPRWANGRMETTPCGAKMTIIKGHIQIDMDGIVHVAKILEVDAQVARW